MENQQVSSLSAEQIKREQATFMTQVYGWMTIALLITGVVSILTASTPALLNLVFGSRITFYALLIGEIVLVGYMATALEKVSARTATGLFLVYAAINGLTIAGIFLVFSGASIAQTFFITAGTFGLMSAYGYYTKRDLTSWGNLLMMALLGLILASVVNFFWQNELLLWITSYVGVLLFVGLTAYDTQKIKEMNIIGNEGTEEDRKKAILGALTLYLDFVNLFLYLLRLFGRKSD